MTRENAIKYWSKLALDVHKQMSADNEFLGPAVNRGEFNPSGLPVADFQQEQRRLDLIGQYRTALRAMEMFNKETLRNQVG